MFNIQVLYILYYDIYAIRNIDVCISKIHELLMFVAHEESSCFQVFVEEFSLQVQQEHLTC